MKRYNDRELYRMDGVSSVCIFFKESNTIHSIDPSKLAWRLEEEDERGEVLTLQEIGDQVKKLVGGYMPPLYVWWDSPLEGEIYQTGNYPGDDSWILLGTTRGYA